MLDSLIIKSKEFWLFSHLSSDFFNARKDYFERYNNSFTYKLWNGKLDKQRSYLKVEAYLNGDSKLLRIQGSLRKWFYGEDSTNDLIKVDFERVIKLISNHLQISFDEFILFEVYKVEIGFNIRLNMPVAPFLSLVAGFSSNCYILRQERGWRHFKAGHFKVTLYDKNNEINNKRSKRGLIKEIEENKQSYENLNLLRIEFTIMRGKAALQNKLGFCSLYEFVDNYQELYKFFWRHCQKLHILEDFPINNMPLKNSWRVLKKAIFEEMIRGQGYDRIMDICSFLEGKVRRDAHTELKKIFSISTGDILGSNKYYLLKAIRRELLFHLIKSGWAKDSSKILPVNKLYYINNRTENGYI